MAKIKINVTGHLFTVTEFPLITDNNVNVDEIEAEFDESWDGYAKIAVFKKKSWQNSLCTLFDCNNIAKLPDTVGSGKLILGIVGIDSESQITTNIKTISIAESAEFDGIEAPEEDVYRQILDSYARVINQRSEIDAEIHRVEAQANANYETVNERVNNLVATDPGSTGDNAELLDIRVGSDGKTYPTAGDAVRVQVSELKSDLVFSYTSAENEIIPNGKLIIVIGNIILKTGYEYKISLVRKNIFEKAYCVHSKISYSDGTSIEYDLLAICGGDIVFTPRKDVKRIELTFMGSRLTESDVYTIEIKTTGRINTDTKWYKSDFVYSNIVYDIRVEDEYIKNSLRIGRIEFDNNSKKFILTILNQNGEQINFLSSVVEDDKFCFYTQYGYGFLRFNNTCSYLYSINLNFSNAMVFCKNEIVKNIAPEYYFNVIDKDYEWAEMNISNKRSTDLTKKVLSNLHYYSNIGYTFYGQEEDYIRGVNDRGEDWRAPDDAFCHFDSDNNIWIPKPPSEIDLNEYSNIYAMDGIHNGKVLALDIVNIVRDYITAKTQGTLNHELNKAKIVALIKKHNLVNNGIVTLCSHMDNPYGGAWNEIDGTYPDAFKCILDESDNGVAKNWFYNFLDCCAELFNSLIDENGELIPVLFRPFHERFENSFWWNHSTDEEWVRIWRKMVDYINERCTNVLWVYNPNRNTTSKLDLTRSYVGDEYVDIIGTDIYLNGNIHRSFSDLKDYFDHTGVSDLYNFAKRHGKVCAIPEMGYANVEKDDLWDIGINIMLNRCGIKPAYCTTWYNTSSNIRVPNNPSTENGQKYISFLNSKCRGYEIDLHS